MTVDDGNWEVSVQGRDSDLRHLARHLTSPPMVIAQSDSDQAYVLQLDAFSACKDSTEVLELAERQLGILSGILKLERNSPDAIRAGAVFRRRNEGRDVFVHVRDTLRINVEMGESLVTVTDANGNVLSKPEAPAPVVRIAELCAEDSSVEKVMRLLAASDAKGWVGLYRIYEVVESDVGSEAALQAQAWGAGSDLKRFKRSANSVTVAGDEARHGKEWQVPPPNPMSLEEAGAYVEQLVRSWLTGKGA